MESRERNWQEFELRDRDYRRGLIFRGQAGSKWRLETTLERSGHPTMPIAGYYDLIVRQVGSSVSSFSSMQARKNSRPMRSLKGQYSLTKPCFLGVDILSMQHICGIMDFRRPFRTGRYHHMS
jgi:hypothetical protein